MMLQFVLVDLKLKKIKIAMILTIYSLGIKDNFFFFQVVSY